MPLKVSEWVNSNGEVLQMHIDSGTGLIEGTVWHSVITRRFGAHADACPATCLCKRGCGCGCGKMQFACAKRKGAIGNGYTNHGSSVCYHCILSILLAWTYVLTRCFTPPRRDWQTGAAVLSTQLDAKAEAAAETSSPELVDSTNVHLAKPAPNLHAWMGARTAVRALVSAPQHVQHVHHTCLVCLQVLHWLLRNRTTAMVLGPAFSGRDETPRSFSRHSQLASTPGRGLVRCRQPTNGLSFLLFVWDTCC